MNSGINYKLAALLTLTGLALTNFAQNGGPFALTALVTAGGGGTSSGGAYRIDGTLGQSAPGPLTGGSFALTGGFWNTFIAVVDPLGPPVSIVQTSATQAEIRWPVGGSEGYVLESSPSLAPPLWTPVVGVPAVSDGSWTLSLTSSLPTQFFRLKKP